MQWLITVSLSVQFNSVKFSCSVRSNSLWPHGLQQARPPCPSPTLRVYSNSCPLSQWCHPTISSSVIPFSCLQSFPASGSFPKSQFFASGGQSISFSFSISSSNGYSGLISFRMDWLDLLAVQGTLKSLLQHRCSKASILWYSAFFIVHLSHPYMTTGKNQCLAPGLCPERLIWNNVGCHQSACGLLFCAPVSYLGLGFLIVFPAGLHGCHGADNSTK